MLLLVTFLSRSNRQADSCGALSPGERGGGNYLNEQLEHVFLDAVVQPLHNAQKTLSITSYPVDQDRSLARMKGVKRQASQPA